MMTQSPVIDTNNMADLERIALTDPQIKADPYALYARLRNESPVCRVRGMTQFFWLVTEPGPPRLSMSTWVQPSDRARRMMG